MGQLHLNKVQKFFGTFEVLKSINLDVRDGEFVVFVIDAAAMARDGFPFHRSDNGVWLTERVPAAYLTVR